MKRILPALVSAVCLLASASLAQSPNAQEPKRTVNLDIRVIDVDARTSEEIERLVRDRNRLTQITGEGKARLVASAQVKVLSGESNSVRVGQRVPVQRGTGAAPPQINYENSGFNVGVSARLLPDNTIEVKLSVELSLIAGDGAAPTFIQRSLSNAVRVKPEETYVVFNIAQSEALLPPVQSRAAADSFRGNFCVLLTAKLVD